MTSAEQRNPQIPLFVEFQQAIPVYGAWARGMITGHFGRKMDAGCGFQRANEVEMMCKWVANRWRFLYTRQEKV